jgi:gamma-glutamylcyclotransferase (GGCT)/AIG2-like uncharacterized protein YtfP
MRNDTLRRLAEILALIDSAKPDAVVRAIRQAKELSGSMSGRHFKSPYQRQGYDYYAGLEDMIDEADRDGDAVVFVYGTLKMGKGNSHLMHAAEYCGEGVVDDYGLLDGAFPYAIPQLGATVEGELYRITDQHTMDRLDMLEGYPIHYTRDYVKVKTEMGDTGAWMYVASDGVIERSHDYKLTSRWD